MSDIAVFGAGAMAGALAPRWAAAGHRLTVSSRSHRTGSDLAHRIGVPLLDWRTAAERAEVVFLAVHWAGVAEALTACGADDGVLEGKVVIDPGNPVEIEHFTLLDPAVSLSERLAERTGAEVAKAFNLRHAAAWAATVGGPPVPVAALGRRAFAVAERLAADLGHGVVDVGGPAQALALEHTAALVIRLLFGGATTETTFALVGTSP